MCQVFIAKPAHPDTYKNYPLPPSFLSLQSPPGPIDVQFILNDKPDIMIFGLVFGAGEENSMETHCWAPDLDLALVGSR